MTHRAPRILFAGGGTGGHVYPAIAIADAVREIEPDAVIEFAGTRERMEWQAVPKAGYAIHPITVSGFQRSLSARNLSFPVKLGRGMAQSLALIKGFDPDVVVGTGGYVSGPVLLAASLRRKPIVLQEQNAYAGMTNKLLGKRAGSIHIAFPEAEPYFPAGRTVLSGNPTRRALLEATREAGRAHFDIPADARTLFVFGGSLGSGAINDAVERHLDSLLADESHYLLWQTGERYFDAIRPRITEHPRLRLMKYVDRMDLAYAASDLALCRAGAITCSELLVTATPAVLVPSPNVAEDHQTKNAQSLERAGAADLLPETRLQADLADTVASRLGDEAMLERMTKAAGSLARPDAADNIARDVLRHAGYAGA